MKIIILGAGTSIPSAGYSPAAILLQTGSANALLDMGPGTVQRAQLAGCDYLSLDTLFLTHLHSDHTLDLVTFLQANDSTPCHTRTAPIHLYGCQGTKTWFDTLMKAYPGILPAQSPLTITENAAARWNWQGLQVSTALTGHTPASIAYRFDGPDGTFIYTGDAIFSEELAEFCRNADILVAEGSFPSGWVTQDHLNADSLGALAQKAGAKHLVVTHRYPPAHQVNLADEIKRAFSGKVTIARDGTTLTLPEER